MGQSTLARGIDLCSRFALRAVEPNSAIWCEKCPEYFARRHLIINNVAHGVNDHHVPGTTSVATNVRGDVVS